MTERTQARARVVVMMGVSGSGKTTVGQALAAALGWRFVDADAYHPPTNVAKMQRGEPLTDADRAPWLTTLHDVIGAAVRDDNPLVLACSALKARYRDALVPPELDAGAVRFVHLVVPDAELSHRMQQRADHFMPPELLASQLATLEPPRDALVLDGTAPVEQLVSHIREALL